MRTKNELAIDRTGTAICAFVATACLFSAIVIGTTLGTAIFGSVSAFFFYWLGKGGQI